MAAGYRFGEFEFDAQRRLLHRGGREITLGARAFGVLELLLENAGRVVSRTDLIDGVWQDIAVTDDSLARAVSDIRTALGDHASSPRYIRTIHRQGYLFVASVDRVDGGAPSSGIEGRGKRWRHRNLLFLATLIALVVASTVVLQRIASPPGAGGEAFQPDFTTWKLRALGPSSFTTMAIKPAFAKSHDLLAVVAPDPGTGIHSLFLLRPDGGEPLQLTRNIEVRGPSPEFTADDSHIIFTTYNSDPDLGLVPAVWVAPVPAGEPRLLIEHASAASPNPDGTALVYAAMTSDGTSIRIRHEDGRDLEVAGRGYWPRWSPDGDWIAYTTSDPEGGDGLLHVARPDGREHRTLTTIPSQHYGLCWTPDGSRVIFASDQGGPTALWSVAVDTGDLIAVTRGPGICTAPTVSSDGKRLVFDFSDRRWSLYLAADPGAAPRRVLMEPGLEAAAISPEGGMIALALGAEAQSPAIAVLDLGTMERRTLSGMAAEALAWMPDGRSLLVAAAAPDGRSQWIWRLPIGGGLPSPILKGQAQWEDPSPAPNGLMLAAVRCLAPGCQLLLHDFEQDRSRILLEKASIDAPRWSPDGRFLAWSGKWRPEDLGSGGIWISAIHGGAPRRLAADGAWPVWEADGKNLLFVRFLEHEGIWRIPLDGGPPSLVRRLEGNMRALSLEGLDISRTGNALLLILSSFTGEIYALERPGG